MRNANIEAGFDHWPVLTWSRFSSFPYQHLQALKFDYGSIYCYTALIIWSTAAFVALLSSLLSILRMLLERRILPEYDIWLCSLFATLALPTRVYIARLEGIHAATARARSVRYLWASSFWDEDKAKKILSRSHWTTSLYPFLIDMGLAIIFTLIVSFALRRSVSVDWLFSALGPFALEYYVRCLFHIFVQLQWFCSTLELHQKRTHRLFSSLMSMHFFRVWTVIFCWMFAFGIGAATIGAFFMLRVLFLGQDDGETSWTDYLFGVIGLLGFPAGVVGSCFFLFISGCQIWNVVRDTLWRVKRTYSWDDWTRRHTTTTPPDREIQLV